VKIQDDFTVVQLGCSDCVGAETRRADSAGQF
jgi:hypothetical protein